MTDLTLLCARPDVPFASADWEVVAAAVRVIEQAGEYGDDVAPLIEALDAAYWAGNLRVAMLIREAITARARQMRFDYHVVQEAVR